MMNGLDISLLQLVFTGTSRVNSLTDNKDMSVSEFRYHLLQFFFTGTRRVNSSTDNKDMSVSEFQRQLELAKEEMEENVSRQTSSSNSSGK